MSTARHHVVISGTGRSGTSFLVSLLTHLGVDTGFAIDDLVLDSPSRAGLEHDIRRNDAPYVVKSPWLCSLVDEVIARQDIVIDHAVVPIRDLQAAAESRTFVQEAVRADGLCNKVRGGLWLTDNPNEQPAVLAALFHNLILGLVRTDIPITFCDYPRIVQAPGYLWGKLRPIFFAKNEVDYKRFKSAFYEVVKPELVHKYTPDDA